MRMYQRALRCVIGVVCVLLIGCGDTDPSTGNSQLFSSMSEVERSSFRSLMRHFHEDTVDGFNATSIAPLIIGEGLRFFPHASVADDYRVDGFEFSLMDALPKNDYWGDWAASGGYTVFLEGSDEIHRRSAYFSSGEVEDFAYAQTSGSTLIPLESRQRTAESFGISSDATYHEDTWHQTVARTYTSDSDAQTFTYDYASHPKLVMTLEGGASYAKEEVVVDTITTSSGWTSVTEKDETWDIKGEVTRYRPSNANASRNTASPIDDYYREEVSDGIRTTSTLETTVNESEAFVGIRSEVKETRELRASEWGTFRFDASIVECAETCVGSKGSNVADDCPGCSDLDGDPLAFACSDACDASLFRSCFEGCESSSGQNSPYVCEDCDLSEEDTLTGFCNRSCQGPNSDFYSGRFISSSTESHSTESVSYTLRPGYGYDAVAARGLEFVQDHVTTTRTLVDVTVSGAQVTTVTTVYRHTDNRKTRNSIGAWKSTRQEVRRTYRLEQDSDGFIRFEWDAVDDGEEWLTSELEVE